MTAGPRVLVISGSVRARSYTRVLAETISGALEDAGAMVQHWSLRSRPLEIADPELRRIPGQLAGGSAGCFLQAATDCDAFVLASPVYHNSYSGVLKNSLDHLDVPHFSYKAVGLAGHGGNRSTQAVDHLRIVVRGLRGVALPTQICTADDDYERSGDGTWQLCNEQLLGRLRSFVIELVVLAHHLRIFRQGISQPCVSSAATAAQDGARA